MPSYQQPKKGHIRPEIHQLDYLVPAANAVDTSESLDDTHRVPMNIVVDQIIAVLQILPFGDAVGGDQNIDLLCTAWHQYVPPLGDGREAGQHIVQGSFQSLDGGASVNTSGSAFSDTAEYLYDQVARYVKEKYGLDTAVRTGSIDGRTTIKGLTPHGISG